MKRLLVLLALSGAVAVSACDDPRPAEPEVGDTMTEAPVAPSIEDAAAPVAESAAPAPPLDSSTMPSEKKTSEESVEPESETLFY